MKPSQKILVFDFDGVICNSFHDSLMTALNTYIQCVPNHTLPLHGPLGFDSVFQFEKDQPDFSKAFLQWMPMGNRAEDYFVILRLIEKKENLSDQSGFDAYRASFPEDVLRTFHERFYQTRTSLRESDREGWLTLLSPFTDVVHAIPFLSQRFTLAIATSKDRISVNLLLQKYGVSMYFLQENILDKDFSESKRSHLINFHRQHNVPYENIHFIDDKVLHLVSVKDLGIHGYLALWGFNTPREQEVARKEGIPLLRTDDLLQLGVGLYDNGFL